MSVALTCQRALRAPVLRCIALVAAAGFVEAQSEPEVLVSPVGVSMFDPEWSFVSPEMAYCDNEGLVRVIATDPETGYIAAPDDEGTVILGSCSRPNNGPEWGYTESEVVLAWNSGTGSGLGLATRAFDSEAWTVWNPLVDSAFMRNPFPIRNQSSPAPWLFFLMDTSTAAVRSAFEPETLQPVTDITEFPTWIPDSNQVVYLGMDNEVLTRDVYSHAVETLTGPKTGEYVNPWGWQAPETGSLAVLLEETQANCFEIYADLSDDAPSKAVCIADFGPDETLVSPEPFVFDGRSYLAFLVRDDSGEKDNRIFVMGAIDLPGETEFLVKISGDTPLRRIEPEPVIIGSRAFIYFSAPSSVISRHGIYLTRFLGRPPYPPVDSDEDGISDHEDNCVQVFNPLQSDSNGDGIGNSCDADTTDDCVVNASDLGLMKSVFFTADSNNDLTGGGAMMTEPDGVVNVQDLGVMRSQFFTDYLTDNPSGIPNDCDGNQ